MTEAMSFQEKVVLVTGGNAVTHKLDAGRHAWLQVLQGSVILNHLELNTSDGAAISDEAEIRITANDETEIMLFDLA